MVKLSVSIPDEVYKAMLNVIPDGIPFSQGLTALIKTALGFPQETKSPIVISNTQSITSITPEIRECITEIVRSEINRVNPLSPSTLDKQLTSEKLQQNHIITENIELSNLAVVGPNETNPDNQTTSSQSNTQDSGVSEWIKQSEIVQMLPETILLWTRKNKSIQSSNFRHDDHERSYQNRV